MFSLQLIGIILVVLTFYYHWTLRNLIRCSWNINGPLAFPFIGNMLNFYSPNVVFEQVAKYRKIYNIPYRFWLGRRLFIYFEDAEMLKNVLNSKDCINKSEVYKFISHFLGDGIFASKVPKWNIHRKILNPTFSHKILLSFFPIFNTETDKMIGNLEQKIGKGPFSLQRIFAQCVMDITCQTTMGIKMNIQEGENNKVLRAFQIAKKISGMRIFVPWYQSEILFFLSGWKSIQKNVKNNINSFVTQLVKTREKMRQERPITENDDENLEISDLVLTSRNIFIDQALDFIDDTNFTIEHLKDNANIIVAAAFDTTVVSVSYVILCLANYPQYQKRVIEEIRTLFPNKGCYISFEDTKNMVYTEMVINETLRLFPPVPWLAREVSQNFYITPDIMLPKGTQLAIDVFNLHRNEKYWGPNSHIFNPDNFLPENIRKMHPYAYIPFSKGPRICIGMKYAQMSIKVQLAKIFQNYWFTSKFKLEDLRFRMDVTIKAVNQPLVEIHRIED